MLIHHFLEESAKRYPDKVALIHEDIRATYVEINDKANQLSYWLMAQGIVHGDRVVLLLENSLEYVVGYYGILKAGAVAVPLSTDLKPDGLRPLFAEVEPRVILSFVKFERVLKDTDLSRFPLEAMILKSPKMEWSYLPFPVHSWDELVSGNSSKLLAQSEAQPAVGGQLSVINDRLQATSRGSLDMDLASIIYTSGSTGKPKGVMLSHRNVVSNTHSICGYLKLTEEDIQMVVLPFFYVMGKSLLNTHFAVGGTVVINNKFAFPAAVINQMVDEHVTGFSGVPSTYAYLLHRSPLAKCRDRLGSLRYCSQAGGHMSAAVKQELRRVLPERTKIYIMYGATEASARLTYLEPERFEEKMGSIGKPIPGVTLRVLGPDGCEVPVAQTGELVVRGPNIMLGYWRDDKGTAEVLGEHGYFTGDLGYQDAEGYFYVTGRKDDLLKVGGHRINPQEVEDALMGTQLAIEAVVLGQPDALLGHRLVAIVCPKNRECSESLILGECSKRLPRYKMPSEIKLLQSLPKNSNGKIDRAGCLGLFLKAQGSKVKGERLESWKARRLER
jgi:acyl-CoA synthetase (AMP-forming)/AMP-acid ligase II